MSTFKPYSGQDYETIKSDLLKSGQLFEDPEFAATEQSVYKFRRYDYLEGDGEIVWKRPAEIVDDPEFIVNGVNPKDLCQSKVFADCWLIAATGCVATNPKYIEVNVPKDQSFKHDYCGLFHFRFWQYGEWYDVVIDDRLPVNPKTNQLVFCSNGKDKNEFWGPLIEKAYAKTATCYEFLEDGFLNDAIVDYTGGVSEKFYLDQARNLGLKFWKYIRQAEEMGSLCGAAVFPFDHGPKETILPNGLVVLHAYSITKVIEIEPHREEFNLLSEVSGAIQNFLARNSEFGGNEFNATTNAESFVGESDNNSVKLMRLRNPWGDDTEWKGKWSESSDEWKGIDETTKEKIGLVCENDGEFWMEFSDFMANFNILEFVHVNVGAFYDEIDAQKKIQWNFKQFNGEWIPGVNAGGSGVTGTGYSIDFDINAFLTNPQYVITIRSPDHLAASDGKTTIIVSLIDKQSISKRFENGGEMFSFPKQFRLYRVIGNSNNKSEDMKFSSDQLQRIDTSDAYSPLREVTKRFRVDPGEYVIIPSTYDKNAPGKFLLRLFSEVVINDEDVRQLNVNAPPNYNPDTKNDILKDEDMLYDSNGNLIYPLDLSSILDDHAVGEPISGSSSDRSSNNHINRYKNAPSIQKMLYNKVSR